MLNSSPNLKVIFREAMPFSKHTIMIILDQVVNSFVSDTNNDNDDKNAYDNDNFGSSGELTCLSQNLNSVVPKLGDAELLVSEQNCDQND